MLKVFDEAAKQWICAETARIVNEFTVIEAADEGIVIPYKIYRVRTITKEKDINLNLVGHNQTEAATATRRLIPHARMVEIQCVGPLTETSADDLDQGIDPTEPSTLFAWEE